MFFICHDMTDEFNLQRAKIIAKEILDWDSKHHQLTHDELDKLHAIIKPTLAIDQNINEIYQLCLQLRDTLVFTDEKGAQVRFYVDEVNRVVYFGDEAGIAQAIKLNANHDKFC